MKNSLHPGIPALPVSMNLGCSSPNPDSNKYPFVCPKCGTEYMTRDMLAMHMMDNVRSETCSNPITRTPSANATKHQIDQSDLESGLKLHVQRDELSYPAKSALALAGMLHADNPHLGLMSRAKVEPLIHSLFGQLNWPQLFALDFQSSSKTATQPIKTDLGAEEALLIQHCLRSHGLIRASEPERLTDGQLGSQLTNDSIKLKSPSVGRTMEPLSRWYPVEANSASVGKPPCEPKSFGVGETKLAIKPDQALSPANSTLDYSTKSSPIGSPVKRLRSRSLSLLDSRSSAELTLTDKPSQLVMGHRYHDTNKTILQGPDRRKRANFHRKINFRKPKTFISRSRKLPERNYPTLSESHPSTDSQLDLAVPTRSNACSPDRLAPSVPCMTSVNDSMIKQGKIQDLGPGKWFNYVCPYCTIGFAHQSLYGLHMGMHCVNNPWKCNMCGKLCDEVFSFTAHTLHFHCLQFR